MKKTSTYHKGFLKKHSTGWWVVYEEYRHGNDRIWAEEVFINVIDYGDVKPESGATVWFAREEGEGGPGARLASSPVTRELVQTPDGVTMVFEINQEWTTEFKNGYAQAIDDIKKMLDEFGGLDPGD
jgi:hypothetical protein